MSMSYVIHAKYNYYANTLRAPENGYMRDRDDNVLKFSSKTEALNYLKRSYSNLELCSGQSTYRPAGTYMMEHGEYARPRFTIRKA